MDDKTAKKLKELEKYLLEKCARPVIAADRLSNIIGVLIDIKPSCMIDFNLEDAKKMNLKTVEKLFKELGLKFIYEKTDLGKNSYMRYCHTYYIAKTKEVVDMIFDAEHELLDTFSEHEPDDPVVAIIHRRIGRLLGYPETATDWFLVRQHKIDASSEIDEDLYKDIENYHHFIHSRVNGEEEFDEYDRPIHEAMEKYTPDSAKLLRETSGTKRWL